MRKGLIAEVCLIGLCFFITSCTHNVDPNTYKAREVGIVQGTQSGVIMAKRSVRIDGNSGFGGAVGAIAGMEAGKGLGDGSIGHLIGMITGAVFGGVAGEGLDHKINDRDGYEYLVRLKDGSNITIVQTKNINFAIHQPVIVIFGPKARLLADTQGLGRTLAAATPKKIMT